MADAARPDVLCIGAVLWDVIGRSPAPMAPGADVPGRIRHLPGGVALNVAMDLEPFARINPCGYAGLEMVRLSDLVQDYPTLEQLASDVVEYFNNTDYFSDVEVTSA